MLLTRLLNDVLPIIERVVLEHPVSAFNERRTVFGVRGEIQHPVEPRPLWEQYVTNVVIPEIRSLESLTAIIDSSLSGDIQLPPLVLSDDAGQPIVPGREARTRDVLDKLGILLSTLLLRYANRGIDRTTISRHIDDFIATWLAPAVVRSVVAPLLGVEGEIDGFSLAADLAIERLTPEWKTEIWNAHHNYEGDVPLNQFAGATYALVHRYRTTRAIDAGGGAFHERANSALLALRLVGDGGVYILRAYDDVEPNLLLQTRSSSYMSEWHRPPRFFGLGPYIIRREMLGDLSRIFDAISDHGVMRGAIRVASARFADAYAREKEEDRIIDLCIALESVLIGGRSDTKARLLALKGAILLWSTHTPKQTYRLLAALYDARNSIVHKGVKILDLGQRGKSFHGIPKDALASQGMAVTRGILRAILERGISGESLPDVADQLDETLIDALLTREFNRTNATGE